MIKLFSFKLLFESLTSANTEVNDTRTLEESIVLIRANNSDEAIEKIKVYAISRETKYDNAAGGSTEWKFVNIIDFFEVIDDSLVDFSEVYSRFLIVDKKVSTKDVMERFYQH